MKSKLLPLLLLLIVIGVPAFIIELWVSAGGLEMMPGLDEMARLAERRWETLFPGEDDDDVVPARRHEEALRSEGPTPVADIVGLTYDEARNRLMAIGWKPNRNAPEYGKTDPVKKGNGPVFWNRGYTEVRACAGGAPWECVFEMFDPGHNIVVVTTEGQEDVNGTIRAKVVRTAVILEPNQGEDDD